MKSIKLIFILFIFTISIQSHAQKTNEFRIYYGLNSDSYFQDNDLIGGGSYDVLNNFEFGFKYLKLISKNLQLETGINYAKLDVEIHPAPMFPPLDSRFDKMKIISIPLYLNYTFLKYVFINAGPMIDINLSNSTIESQSGIGFGLGIGGKFDFKHFSVFINPIYKKHSLLSFENNDHRRKLNTTSFQFGICYKLKQ